MHDGLDALVLEPVPSGGALQAARVQVGVEILDRPAARADEVVVRLGARVVEGRAGALDAAHVPSVLRRLATEPDPAPAP